MPAKHPTGSDQPRAGTDRRGFLKTGIAAGAALAVAPFGTGRLPLSERADGPRARRGPRGPRKRVAVVGAGLAGLAAAWELSQRGHDVTVLEARTRPGGRVLTLRHPFADALYAEAGPISIPNHHDLPRRYAEQFGLKLVPTAAPRGAAVGYVEGRRIAPQPAGSGATRSGATRSGATRSDASARWPEAYRLTEEERALGRRRRELHYVDPVLDEIGDPSAAGWPAPELAKYDRMTYAEFLHSRGASAGAVARTRLGFRGSWGDGIDSYSALDGLRALALQRAWRGGDVIEGGMDGLPRAFAARLRGHIRYGAAVVRLEQREKTVRAVYRQATGQHQHALEVDRLVCAIPFSVLRTIEVAPAFSPDKQRVIRELTHSSVARVFVQFRRRFWRDDGLSGAAFTDLPVGRIMNPTAGQPGPRGILEAFITGVHARRVTAMAERERLRSTIDDLVKLFPGAAEHAEGGASKCWDEDPWARGEYCWFRPGEMIAMLPHIAPAEHRVHFAGEQASAWPGWMQGALESGIRAAREVDEAPI